MWLNILNTHTHTHTHTHTAIKYWAEDLNIHFSKEGMQMVKRYMKRCSTLLINREKHIKTTMRCHFTPVRMAIIKQSTNNRCAISYDISCMGKS